LRGGSDEAGAHLRKLSAKPGLCRIVQDRFLSVLDEDDVCAPLAETGNAALSLAEDRITFRRVEIGQRDLAVEAGRYRSESDPNDRRQRAGSGPLDASTARNAMLERIEVVQGFPDRVARCRNTLLAFDIHAD